MDWREAETKRPRRRDTARASLGGDTQTEQAGGNQAQGGRWGEGDPSGPPAAPSTRPGLAPTWLSPGAVVPPSRAPSRGRTAFGRGAAASEPPRPRRPSPRPQRLTRRGRGIAPAPGGGAGIQSIPGKRRSRRWGQGEPENREPRSGDGRARRGQRDRTGLGIHWLCGLASRDQKAVQAEDRVLEKESTAIPRGPGAQDPRCRGRDPAGILGEGEGSSRSRGRAGGGGPGTQRRAGAESRAPGLGSARFLGRKARVGEASRDAQQPGGPDSWLRASGPARPASIPARE